MMNFYFPIFIYIFLSNFSFKNNLKCPTEMIEIKGNYCPEVEQICLNYDKKIHNVNGYAKCDIFKSPSKCLSKNKKHLNFCIDKFEGSANYGEKPPIMISWNQAKNTCEKQNKRLCYDYEWTFACEGEDMLPYPYGYIRNDKFCNIDKQQKIGFNSNSIMTNDIVKWLDQRVAAGSMECKSSFGVFDLTGNVDEATINSKSKPFKNALKGGHWVIGARNRCRPSTLAHDENFANYETSYRCCSDIF